MKLRESSENAALASTHNHSAPSDFKESETEQGKLSAKSKMILLGCLIFANILALSIFYLGPLLSSSTAEKREYPEGYFSEYEVAP